MKILSVLTATTLLLVSTTAGAWWNNRNNSSAWNNNNWYNNGYYDGYGDSTNDGSLGFHGDFRFKMKMRGKGDSRGNAYNYWELVDEYGNRWDSGYYDSYGRYYGNQQHYRRPSHIPRMRSPR